MTETTEPTGTTSRYRLPVTGVIEAKSRTRLVIDPPMDLPREQPAILTSSPESVVIVGGSPGWVDVENRSDRSLTFVLFVIPALVGRALVAPWREAARMLQAGASDPRTLKRVGMALLRGLANRMLKEVPK